MCKKLMYEHDDKLFVKVGYIGIDDDVEIFKNKDGFEYKDTKKGLMSFKSIEELHCHINDEWFKMKEEEEGVFYEY